MKKFMLILSAVIVLLSSATSEVLAETESEKRLMNDLICYIYHCEIIYDDILWIADAYDRFDRERNWESLQIARAAVTIAEGEIERLKLPDLKMTAEDRRDFMKRGIDVSIMGNMKQMFEAEKTAHKNIMVNLHNFIMRNVFRKDDWQIAMRKSANDRNLMNLELHYLADMADWVLASLNDPEFTKKFNAAMKDICPKTHAFQRKKLESPEKIDAECQETLNQINDVATETTKILGAMNNKLNVLTHSLETGNVESFESIKKQVMKISNMPVMINWPSWFKDKNISYFWEKDEKIQPLPKARTKLERIPDICRGRIDGVRLDQVKAYQDELKKMGLQCKASKEENGKLDIYYMIGGSTFAVSWENGNVTILMMEKPFYFVPKWYLLAVKK